jgi:hypothetical protein
MPLANIEEVLVNWSSLYIFDTHWFDEFFENWSSYNINLMHIEKKSSNQGVD